MKGPVFMDVKSRGGFGLMYFVQCHSRNHVVHGRMW